MSRKPRQYEPTWQALRESRSIELVLQPDNLTEKQILKQAATIRKAISKEKYMDTSFKVAFPDAEIESTRKGRTISFTLVLNSANPFTDF